MLWMPFNALILFTAVSPYSWKSNHPSQILFSSGNAACNGKVSSNFHYIGIFITSLQFSRISKSTNTSYLMELLIH